MATIFEEVASVCFSLGIRASMLLCWHSCPATYHHLPELDEVTNQIVLELYAFKDWHGESYETLHCWLKYVYGPEVQEPSRKAITRSIERLKARLSKLKKHCDESIAMSSVKADNILKFLQEEYILPKLGIVCVVVFVDCL